MATLNDYERAEPDRFLDEIAQATGGTLRIYPPPGRALRGVVLRDIHDGKGSQYEATQLEDDGILRVIGHDQGPGGTEIFGDDITSYEWVYVIAPDKVRTPVRLLGGKDGDDVLALLAACHQQPGERSTTCSPAPIYPPSSATGTARARTSCSARRRR